MKATREKKYNGNAAAQVPFLQRAGKNRAAVAQGQPFISRKFAGNVQSKDPAGGITHISGKIVQRSLLDDALNIVSPGLGQIPGLGESIWDAGKWVGEQSVQNLEFLLDHAADFSKDVLWNYASLYMRRLYFHEAFFAYFVFGDSIDYSQILINEDARLAKLSALLSGEDGMAVTTFHVINFSKPINTTDWEDMAWLIHELTHVAQYEHVGAKYMAQAVIDQHTAGYGYTLGRLHLSDYNREQQGDIAEHYFRHLIGKGGALEEPYKNYSLRDYQPYITELRLGQL